MSSFGYVPLHEVSSPVPADSSPDLKSPLSNTKSPPNQLYDSLSVGHDDEAVSAIRTPGTNPNSGSNTENVRYTALRPTLVSELSENGSDPDPADPESRDSTVIVTLTLNKKKKLASMIYVIICGLLIACVILVAFVMVYVFIILPESRGSPQSSDPRVKNDDNVENYGEDVVMTTCGPVRGVKEDGVYVFRGMPYALPPTGTRRWKRPVPRSADTDSCWQNVYNATKYGNKCVQSKLNNSSEIEGSEDCLYVNVWTPYLSSETLLPVLVWFHSGDFVYGSGDTLGMSPNSRTSAATSSVYVSFNYRLGVFGFLALEDLREEGEGSAGNYGFWDQLLLLKWVKNNIRRFGGNQNMITIFGHSSGATSIQAMLSSPQSSGLFQKAWLSSPVAVINKTIDQACRDNHKIMTMTGCNSIECLRQVDAVTLSKSSPWPLQVSWALDSLLRVPIHGQLRNDLPIIDGHVVPSAFLRHVSGRPGVPVVFGSTYVDLSSMHTEGNIVNMTWREYDDKLDSLMGVAGAEFTNQVKSLYSHKNASEYTNSAHLPSPAFVQFSHLLMDIKDVCPTKILADGFIGMYSSSAPVYMYVAEIIPSLRMQLSRGHTNVFIGWDMVAFFDTFQDLSLGEGQTELNFQNVVREEIMTFIKFGKPDASRWKTADVNYGVIGRDVTITPETSEYFDKCSFWKRHGFFNYSWKNSTY